MANLFQKYKWKVLLPLVILGVLALAFYMGGNSPGSQGWEPSDPTLSNQTPDVPKTEQPTTPDTTRPGGTEDAMTAQEKLDAAAELAKEAQVDKPKTEEPKPETPAVSQDKPAQDKPITEEKPAQVINPDTGKDKYNTAPTPDNKPTPVEPQDAKVTDNQLTCTISISCATVKDNLEWLDPEKKELIPEDGVVLAPVSVTFYEGESVFNVLSRVCKQNKIHMEFTNTPMYNSAYIEGIHNLYEFDCGELSGWMYNVNGWYPNYGSSRYQLQDGDVIEWKYTCNLGVDIGGYNDLGNR